MYECNKKDKKNRWKKRQSSFRKSQNHFRKQKRLALLNPTHTHKSSPTFLCLLFLVSVLQI